MNTSIKLKDKGSQMSKSKLRSEVELMTDSRLSRSKSVRETSVSGIKKNSKI